MLDDDIDLDRIIIDPAYRRAVIARLNAERDQPSRQTAPGGVRANSRAGDSG